MKRCLCFLFLFSFLSSASALGINVPSQAAVNQPTRVTWSLDPGDETTWDFRFVLDGWDVGLAAANVVAGGMSEGQIDVTFDRIGDFVIVAVAGPQSDVIGQSLTVQVLNALPTSSSALPSTTWYNPLSQRSDVPADQSPLSAPSVSISTVFESATSSPSPLARIGPQVSVPAVVGSVVGVLFFILLLILLFIYFRRRKSENDNKPTRRFTFHRSWMVRARDDPAPGPSMADISSAPVSGGPRGPRPGKNLRPFILDPVRTERQQMLDERVVELLEDISSLPLTPAPGARRMSDRLGEIRRKIRWAREMKDSPWARGETDDRPVGWEECMA